MLSSPKYLRVFGIMAKIAGKSNYLSCFLVFCFWLERRKNTVPGLFHEQISIYSHLLILILFQKNINSVVMPQFNMVFYINKLHFRN